MSRNGQQTPERTHVMNTTTVIRSANLSLPDARFIEEVVEAAAQPSQASVHRLLGDLEVLVEAAYVQLSARFDLQRRLYWLHYGQHEASYSFRQWLASTTYRYFEETALPVTPVSQDSETFVGELASIQKDLSPLDHPLFRRCFSDDGTLNDVSVYLRHKWIIMLTFWRSLSEYGARIQRHDIHNTALVYENVHEELGAGDAGKAHLVKHYNLLRSLGVEVAWDDEPEFSETYEYVNFRLFCMRHPDLAWGLGSFFSQEASSLEYTLGHYQQLRRLGVDHSDAEVFYSHDEIDSDHTEGILTMVRDLVHTDAQRATVLRAQRQQMQLWHSHFGRVLEQIVAGGQR
jgi:pyrroloquinoline quinone (PQQ) biosynthesis protein C